MKENNCKGLYYQADVHIGKTRSGLVKSVRLNKLKIKSCNGCKYCSSIEDYLQEISENWSVLGLNDVKNGKIYKLLAVHEYIDLETDFIESYNLKLEEK